MPDVTSEHNNAYHTYCPVCRLWFSGAHSKVIYQCVQHNVAYHHYCHECVPGIPGQQSGQ